MSETRQVISARITVGIDLGDRYSEFCFVDAAGTVLEDGRLRTTAAALRRYFTGRSRMLIVIEVGTHSPWVNRLLEECGHEVIVANARKVRLIYASDNKTDQVDAESLARLGRLDAKLLAPIRHRGAEAQADLATLRSRECLVRTRTQLINYVRGAVKAVGGRLPSSSAPAFPHKAADHIPEELRSTMMPLLAMIDSLSGEIRAADRRIEQLARERYAEMLRLRQVAGVGPITSLCFVLTLEDPSRFPNSRAVGAYLGMCPRHRDSGVHLPQLRISKSGDSMLRRLLVCSAHYILGPFGPDCDLRTVSPSDRPSELVPHLGFGVKDHHDCARVSFVRSLIGTFQGGQLRDQGVLYQPLAQVSVGEVHDQAFGLYRRSPTRFEPLYKVA